MNEVFIRLLYGSMIAGGILMIVVGVARADNGTPSSFWRPDHGWQREHAKPRHGHRHRPHRHKSTRVKAWRIEVPTLPAGCIARIDVVGDRRPGTKAAQDQALQSLRQEAVFRFGEMYADDKNLQDVSYQCVTTTINNSFTGAIDKARQLVGGEDGLLHRCRISAVVCRAPLEAVR